jgi:hypothetical protein
MIYISGKITDETREKELANLKRFDEKEVELAELGWDVFNPGRLECPGWKWEQYLARDLLVIFKNRPVMYMMTGWEESRGARLEYQVALLLGLQITFECPIFQENAEVESSPSSPQIPQGNSTTPSLSYSETTSSGTESPTSPTTISSEPSKEPS